MASSCLASSDNTFGPIVQGCRSNFDFTLLFEQSILSIAPAALFLLAAPPRLSRLLKRNKKTIPNHYRISKALGLLICWSRYRVTRATVPSAVLSFLASVVVLFLSRFEHSRAVRPSSLLIAYLLVSVAFDAVQVRTLFLRHDESSILGLFTTSVALKLILLLFESMNKRRYLRAPYNSYPPESTSGLFGRIFFWWLNPMLATGFRTLMTLDDLFVPDKALQSEPLGEQMKKSWNKYRSSGRWALTYAIFHSLRYSLAMIVFPRLCLIGFNYAQPFLISSAIDYVSLPPSAQNKNDGYGLIGATALIYLGITFCTTHYQHQIYRSCTQFRGGMIALIYDKTLTMRAGIADESRSLTLMGTDIDRLVVSLDSLCEAAPRVIELSIGIWLLAIKLGWACVAPIVIVIISIMASSRVTKLVGPRQRQWVAAIQRRVSMTSSMLGSMKSVKMMGLSNILTDTLQDQRVRELDLSKHFRVMGLWRMMLSFLPQIVGPLATFIIYAIQASANGSPRLNNSATFTSLSIISLLTTPASDFLMSLPLVGMSTGCLDRIQNFLLNEECEDGRVITERRLINPDSSANIESDIELQDMGSKRTPDNIALSVQNITIRPALKAPPALHDISFSAPRGSLTMIIGVVGSGKSTLLKALVGELPYDTGSISAQSQDSAYCSQTPWLQNASVRNIICSPASAEIDEQWYRTVIHACALNHDILDLPDQDDTLIGSRGVTLSGGQKQRLALARAVYARSSLVVLDDVLSAIDAATEHLIVERLFSNRGIFRRLGTTVVLATHAIRHLPLADNIIALEKNGRVLEQGTFEQLRAQGGFVSNLIIHPGVLEKEKIPGAQEKALATKTTPVQQPPDASDLTRRIGDISVYKYYFKSIGWKVVTANLVASFVYMLGRGIPPLWLAWYADGTITSLTLFSVIYATAAIVALLASSLVLYTLYMEITPRSGAKLHKILLNSVMRAPQSFFDKTDSGIILNRFSQDMTLIDGNLPAAAVMASSAGLQILAQFALIALGSNYMAVSCPILIVAAYFLQKFYLRTSRQMRFLDLECKSPLFTHFTETLEGLSTIRAFGWQKLFAEKNIKHLDTSQRPYYLLYCIQRWLNLVLLLIVGVMATAVMALATNLHGSTSGGRLGISLSSIVMFNAYLALFMQFWTQLETSLGAVARVKGFEESTESEHKEQETFEPPENWPTRGEIELKNVSASYGDVPALRNVTFTIKPGEKIGICGRTGSGKSTLLSVLLRLVDMTAGTIKIDNLDLSLLPRETIRSRITAIPQDPFILAGSVRLNADPTSTSSDSDIITALTKVNLWPLLSSRGGLDADMSANPLSQGQQQIFCLARAMLRSGNGTEDGENRILVLDEATSNVDAETDKLMQKLVREEFGKYTILTVAHRLDTILDADRVVVMEGGRVVEMGSPSELLKMEDSTFRTLRGRSE